ncbi:putative uncharacterized protein DDB_G0282133 isoform X1 [Microplitis mediator]|uniref:putative uncharacterized protein DDB_G0282133 isoform X1 n=2 Tax=Microplitis mediator TaxID=375433 RepID=UPI0025524897|nr:putative uncharacterized protein DDB_G0282133 isoform X1 [Microplitis mediator]
MDSAENLNTGTDSDGSVSWEDFFGASTDLVPQLLGMFDELARKTDCNNHYHNHNHHHGEHIPAAIQKRLSLVAHSQRNSIFGHICANSQQQQQQQQQSQSPSQHLKQVEPMQEQRVEYRDNKSRVGSAGASQVEITVSNHVSTDDAAVIDNQNESNNPKGALNANDDDKRLFRREITDGSGGGRGGLMPEYGSRRRKHLGRPLSGSSIASSTSSSGCSNQGNACSANPYLASVESLADTCASSQGSADSGVVTTSEVNCREVISVNNNNNTSTNNNNNNSNNSNNNSRRISRSIEDSPLLYHRARYCDPKRNPVERVLLEIVDTEAIYVEHLRQVIQGYLIFWRDDPASLLQHLELDHLFSNIEDIFSFNSEFLKEIEACGLDPVSVANTFTKHNSGFKVYTEYCTNYPRTVSVLTDLMSRDDTAKAFRERQAALGHALPLGSFLLKPVQRILKYHLLLENLSKEYEADEKRKSKDLLTKDNRNIIEEALATMTGIAKHINAMKRRHEHAVRVQEIQSLLYGWPGPDLTTSGELIAEGRFRMRGAKAPRHAFLFERMLLLTKKKEDGLLVYKAHIMCSNLMLIESIPGEPCSFHVIPFDNPRLQYTLQARNLEQKREWTLQIKRVMLENYNAVIPIHARQLVLQLGQSQQDDENNSVSDRGSAKKLYSAPPEYLERRKLEKERRRSEAGIRQKIKKTITNNKTLDLSTPDSPASSRKLNDENINNRDRSLNRSLDGRASKVKDRFTNWRRKSEPGFQSYISLNQSDEEKNEDRVTQNNDSTAQTEPALSPAEITNSANIIYENTHNLSGKNSPTANTKEKDINEQQQQQPQEQEQEQKTKVRTVEEIVGHILMQNQEFQRLLEKQRNNSLANVRHQRFKKNQRSVDTSDDSDNGELNYSSDFNNINNSNNSRVRPTRIIRREHRLVRSNNAWNSLSSQGVRDNQPSLQLQYNNLHIDDNKNQSKMNRVQEKRAVFEAFKRQSIVTESKIIKTALRMRENSPDKDNKLQDKNIINDSKDTVSPTKDIDDCNYAWDEFKNERCSKTSADSPTRPAVWLTKLCQDLPTSPQKSGSLPRSFQINQTDPSKATAEIKQISKARFLQRDGKPMSERPFTIASDKPGEINLDDMEQRYTTASYETDNKINNKFKNSISACSASTSASSSTFFYSVDDNLTDGDSDIHTIATSTSTNIHPDHKIYRANNISGSTMLKNVLSKAGSRLQGLRSTVSAETLECTDDFDKSKRFPSCKIKKKKKFNNKLRLSRESSTDVDEPVIGCVPGGNSSLDLTHLYYKQGSSGLGARIAQADYADPSVLFFDIKRGESNISDNISVDNSNVNLIEKIDGVNNDEDDNDDDYYEEDDDDDGDDDDRRQRLPSDGDNYYEKCFESIENYIDETDDAFRDSAIFSDGDEVVSPLIKNKLVTRTTPATSSVVTSDDKNINDNNNKSSDNNFLKKPKIAPPVPVKRKINLNDKKFICENDNLKPNVALKPDNLKLRTRLIVGSNSSSSNSTECVKITVTKETIPIPISIPSYLTSKSEFNCTNNGSGDDGNKNNDVSAGQSQAGWVKKMVGQLQAQIETL